MNASTTTVRRKRRSTRTRRRRGGNRARKTLADSLLDSGAFGDPKSKKEKRKVLNEIEKTVAKENKEQYSDENKATDKE